jgi:hypothetical protein
MSVAQARAPTVNGTIAGHESSSAKIAIPLNTHDSTCAPPMRSASHPPAGRISVASTTNPAARNPASAAVRPNCERNNVGR